MKVRRAILGATPNIGDACFYVNKRTLRKELWLIFTLVAGVLAQSII